jgi:ribosomal protein S18 acetylase RimI-like enzyme
MGSIKMRPALDSDLSFLWWLHQVTMRDYVEKTWGWDSAFQEQRFREVFVADRDGLEIIEESAERIGCLRIVRDATRWFLAAIEIAPSHQGKGVGTLLVENVCQDADALGVPVDLRVLKVNPAIRLYWRLGFALVGETNTHYLMRRGPARTA